MTPHPILRVVAALLVPCILLFALYVQFHGDYGPGGGFQAGVIFTSAIILHILVFGLEGARQTFRPRLVAAGMAGGLLLYGAVGIWAMQRGGRFLDYAALPGEGHTPQHLGITLIELGVGITVASVMVGVFMAFVQRRRI